jgi:hypothetical protein
VALLMETNQEWMGRIYLRMEEQPGVATEAGARHRSGDSGDFFFLWHKAERSITLGMEVKYA